MIGSPCNVSHMFCSLNVLRPRPFCVFCPTFSACSFEEDMTTSIRRLVYLLSLSGISPTENTFYLPPDLLHASEPSYLRQFALFCLDEDVSFPFVDSWLTLSYKWSALFIKRIACQRLPVFLSSLSWPGTGTRRLVCLLLSLSSMFPYANSYTKPRDYRHISEP